jgi:hypothetical protein
MANDEFVAFVGDPDIHDAVVKSVSYNGQQAEVSIETLSGRRIDVSFSDVKLFHAHEPLGMVLYALNEMRGIPPYRKFVFTNSEESSDSGLSLEARKFVCK